MSDDPIVVTLDDSPALAVVVAPDVSFGVDLGIPGPSGPVGPQGPAGGTTLPFTASATLGGQRVVRALPDGTLAYASSDDVAQVGTLVGITTAASSTGASVPVQNTGEMDEPGWAWTPGPVWLGLAGALTQVRPTTGFLQQVATAVAPTRIVLAIGPALVLA